MALSDILSLTSHGESDRLDYIIREHEKLERVVQRLVDALVSNRIITPDEIAGVLGDDVSAVVTKR